jgi:hypothetical protein
VNDEGTWATWSKNLSSQMLSKQPQALAKKQLKNNYDLYKEQYDEIMSLTNPAVRKRLLLDFSSKVDAEAAHLKAAAMPRQANKVLIPIPSLKPNEIYAPGYRDGETVVLIRHPHGGIFEIPELVVNNRNKEGQKILTSNPKDAVGIHPKAAEQLSGADFDGDAVLVIPNNDRSIKTSKPLDRLKDFDPKTSYKETPGMTYMSKKGIGKAMGDISNLITDMTIKGANNDEIANAVRHSMVVIDAYKHKLDYTRSARDHRIPELKKRYQGKSTGGASTLISLASAETRVNQRKERIEIDPKTGKIKYFETGDTYVDKKGKVQPKTIKVTRMSVEDDARKLSSGTPIEEIYADHANRLKALANTSRKDYVTTPNIQRSPTAAVTYKREVDSLKSKLNLAEGEQDRERQAQIIANSKLRLLKENEPALYEEKDKLKKIKGKLIDEARSIVRDGAKREKIDITTKEWEAIQSGAVSNNMLTKILNKADMDQVKSYAMPRTVKEITPAKETRIKAMLDRGYTQAEIGDQLGLSTSIISKFVQ